MSHKKAMNARAPTIAGVGDLRSPWRFLATYKSWDDPPIIMAGQLRACLPLVSLKKALHNPDF